MVAVTLAHLLMLGVTIALALWMVHRAPHENGL